MTFNYQAQQLHAEQCSLESLAKQFGTPLFVYSQQAILLQLAAVRCTLAGTA